MAEILTVLSAVLPVFLITFLGYQFRRINWLTRDADDSLMKVAMNVLLPCLAFSKISGNEAIRQPENVWLPPVVGFFSIAIGMAIGWMMRQYATRETGPKARTYAITIGVFNFGFVPIPLSESLFGADAVAVLFVFNVGTLLAMWSLGVMLLHGDLSTAWKKALNAPFLSVVFALIVNATGLNVHIPEVVVTSIEMLGMCAIPMSILLMGAMMKDYFAQCEFRSAFRVCWTSILLRMGLLPVLMILTAKWLPCSTELRQVILIQASMPAAMFPILISRMYGGSPVIATQVAIATTLISLATIPLWLHLGAAFLGLQFSDSTSFPL